MKNPDFVMLAKAMGVHALRCETVDQLPSMMKEFLEYDGSKPIVMECLVEQNEHVFPMVSNLTLHFSLHISDYLSCKGRRRKSSRRILGAS